MVVGGKFGTALSRLNPKPETLHLGEGVLVWLQVFSGVPFGACGDGDSRFSSKPFFGFGFRA